MKLVAAYWCERLRSDFSHLFPIKCMILFIIIDYSPLTLKHVAALALPDSSLAAPAPSTTTHRARVWRVYYTI